jgi:hypothetical protein
MMTERDLKTNTTQPSSVLSEPISTELQQEDNTIVHPSAADVVSVLSGIASVGLAVASFEFAVPVLMSLAGASGLVGVIVKQFNELRSEAERSASRKDTSATGSK